MDKPGEFALDPNDPESTLLERRASSQAPNDPIQNLFKEPRRRAWSLRAAGDNLADLGFLADASESVRVTIYVWRSGATYDIQLNRTRYEVTAHTNYRLAFRGRADQVREACVGFAKADNPWSNLGLYRTLQLTTDWTDYSEDFVATSDENNARIHFDLGGSGISVELSSVRLWKITDSALVDVERSDRRAPVDEFDGSASTVSQDVSSSAAAGPSWVLARANERVAPRVMPGPRMFAVLGTWMEADIVASTIRNAFAQGAERVYLVDNGSTDGTLETARMEGAVVARSYRTDHYDEDLRLHHMNGVVSEISHSEGDQQLWWLFFPCKDTIEAVRQLSARMVFITDRATSNSTNPLSRPFCTTFPSDNRALRAPDSRRYGPRITAPPPVPWNRGTPTC